MTRTETYVVTDRAGPRVAGRPAKPGDELTLTESAARAEVLAGTLVLKSAKPKAGRARGNAAPGATGEAKPGETASKAD